MKNEQFAVIDFETTGLRPENDDRAIEVGIALVAGDEVVDTYQSLINPDRRVDQHITRMTGINNAMVMRAPKAKKVFQEVLEFVGDSTLVAHNAAFDRRFYREELSRLKLNCTDNFLCTLLISRRLYPWLPNKKLRTLVDMLSLPQQNVVYHRALTDAKLTADLFLRIQRDLSSVYEGEAIDSQFLSKYQKMKASIAKPALEPAKTMRSSSASTTQSAPDLDEHIWTVVVDEVSEPATDLGTWHNDDYEESRVKDANSSSVLQRFTSTLWRFTKFLLWLFFGTATLLVGLVLLTE